MITGMFRKFSSRTQFDYIISHNGKKVSVLSVLTPFERGQQQPSILGFYAKGETFLPPPVYLITVHKHLIQLNLNRLLCDSNAHELCFRAKHMRSSLFIVMNNNAS